MTTPSDTSMLLRLRTRQLLLIRLLDTERNLGRAAAALHISQPAATKLLQQAEEVLGVQLFERLPRGMVPTGHGEVLARYARTVLNDFGVVRQEMSALSSGLVGALRIGSVTGAIAQLVAPALAEYKSRHPRVTVTVRVDISNIMMTELERGDVDLVFGRLTDAHARGDYALVPLLEEALVVVARHDHPLRSSSFITLQDLAAVPWVIQPKGAPQRAYLDAALREAGITRQISMTETVSVVMTTALLEISDMVSVLPASLAEHYGRLGVLCTLPLEMPIRVPAIYMITPQGRPLNTAAAHFRKLVLAMHPNGRQAS